jgi:hypothetical protein
MLKCDERRLAALNLLRNSCANLAQHSRLRSRPQAVLREDVCGKLAVLHQRHRCVYHGRQLVPSDVTSTALHGKENSVRHQIRFHSVVGGSLHQRNLAAFSPAAFAARHRFFPSCRVHRQRRGKCHSIISTFSRSRPVVLVVTSPGDSLCMDGWC